MSLLDTLWRRRRRASTASAGFRPAPIEVPRILSFGVSHRVPDVSPPPIEPTPPVAEPIPRWRYRALAAGMVGIAVLVEVRTSWLQARFLSDYAHRVRYNIAPGASNEIVFPGEGPSNERRGYVEIPRFRSRLEAAGYDVAEQARFSSEMIWLAQQGVTPPFRLPPRSGLVLRNAAGGTLYAPLANVPVFPDPEAVPDLVSRTLLFIENRELGDPAEITSNPAVEWDRTMRASLLYIGRRAGLPLPYEGGSTLATQIEKYRYSAGGRTTSAGDKLRQIAAASLRAYREGPDTRSERQQIILEYLNTMPLSAAPGWGEVQGLGEGLRAWFGMDLDGVNAALASPDNPDRSRLYKHVLALICAVRAPTEYLVRDRRALEGRADLYTRLMRDAGLLSPELARRVEAHGLEFLDAAGVRNTRVDWTRRKAVNRVRTEVADRLGVKTLHDLDRLHLEVDTTIDAGIEDAAADLLASLRDPATVRRLGLAGERMLSRGQPESVLYSFLLFERSDRGNLLRAQVDSLEQPFDLNDGMKLELGSTAKLRTLAHYLEIVATLHQEWSQPAGRAVLLTRPVPPSDAITRWAVRVLSTNTGLSRRAFLERSLERPYSASPGEVFQTGGGAHVFDNFDPEDDGRILSVREATRRSVNLVFVRLMRDIVAYHAARLPYDARSVLWDAGHPQRKRLLKEIAEEEALAHLSRAFREARDGTTSGRSALETWVRAQVAAEPGITWDTLLARSVEVRREATEWLFSDRKRNAQDRRLQTRIERDAFRRMTPEWRRLGFPFERLVPSLATALGSSGDRPAALADLMGIIVNDGVQRPVVRVGTLRFASGTPYHTVFTPRRPPARPAMDPEVAAVLRSALREVVEQGTARRVAGAFTTPSGVPVPCGGKTGSGDNRFETVGANGAVLRSRAVNRTATFVFYVGDRYFGVLTAFVPGSQADRYRFTSALPVAVLRHLAPALNKGLADPVELTAPTVRTAGLRVPGEAAAVTRH